jgi:hypothetical protein
MFVCLPPEFFYNKGRTSVIACIKDNGNIDKNNRKRAVERALVFVLMSGILPFQQSLCVDFASQKSALLQKLDSLDMEKQIRKRKGQSIDDLEKLSATIKDSIEGVKKELTLGDGPATKPDVHPGMQQYINEIRKYLPQNTFDWVVVIVGFIAVIAGVILFASLVGMAWKRIFGKRKQPLKTMRDIFPQATEKSNDEYPSNPQGADIEAGDKKIGLLRRKMNEESDNPPLTDSRPDHLQPRLLEETAGDTEGLKNRIITAAARGADIQEISKKFHVGIDQVSLILRVARQEKETDR